jgi:hypothetical protein
MSASYWGSKKEWTVGRTVEFREMVLGSSSREPEKSKAAPWFEMISSGM